MIEPLRYPVDSKAGRTGVLLVAGAVVAIALGVRYAVALLPSPGALVPAAGAGIVLVLVVGYLSHVLVANGAGPSTRELRSVARAGVRTLTLSVALLFLPALVLVVTVRLFVAAGTTADGTVPTLFLAGSTSTLFLFLAVAYGLPAVLAAVTRDGSVRSAVESDAVFPVLFDPAYAAHWTIGFPLLVVAAGAAAVTVGSDDVTGLLSALVTAYLLLAGVRALGEGCDRAMDPTE